MIYMFRSEIRDILDRLKSAKLPGVAEFKLSSSEKLQLEQQTTDEIKEISKTGNWQKAGNTFWLGHDLMWTANVILSNGPADRITYGFRQSFHHLSELGLDGTIIGERLNKLYETSKRTLQSEWTSKMCNAVAIDVLKLIDQLGELAKIQQQEYKPS